MWIPSSIRISCPKWTSTVKTDSQESSSPKEWWLKKKTFHYSLHSMSKRVSQKVKMILTNSFMAPKNIQILPLNFLLSSTSSERKNTALMVLWKLQPSGVTWSQSVKTSHPYQGLKEMTCLTTSSRPESMKNFLLLFTFHFSKKK